MKTVLQKKTLPRKAITALILALMMVCCVLFTPVTAFAKTDETEDGGTSPQPSVVADAGEDEVVTPNVTTPNSATPPSTATGSTTNATQPGTGNTTDNTTSSGDNTTTGKQFVTVETKSGKIFYLIIDHDKASDNVYLLTEVTENDLLNFVEVEDGGSGNTVGGTSPNTPQKPDTNSTPEPDASSQPEPDTSEPEPEPEPDKSSFPGGLLILLLVVVVGGGAAYYFLKVRKPQSEPLGSMDDFEFEDEDDEDYLMEDEGDYSGEDGDHELEDEE